MRGIELATTSVASERVRKKEGNRKTVVKTRRETRQIMFGVNPIWRPSTIRKKMLSQKRRRCLSSRTEMEKSFSRDCESDDEPDWISSNGQTFSFDSEKKKLKVIELLNALSTKAVGYKNYRLANKSARYGSSVTSRIHQMQKKLNVRIKIYTSSG